MEVVLRQEADVELEVLRDELLDPSVPTPTHSLTSSKRKKSDPPTPRRTGHPLYYFRGNGRLRARRRSRRQLRLSTVSRWRWSTSPSQTDFGGVGVNSLTGGGRDCPTPTGPGASVDTESPEKHRSPLHAHTVPRGGQVVVTLPSGSVRPKRPVWTLGPQGWKSFKSRAKAPCRSRPFSRG